MSEKHLTESAWKSFITKEKFKDSSFGKVLSAYEKTDAKDFDGRLKALADIEKEVATLVKSKEVKANEDVEEYLEEVDREVPKARKAVEAAKKAAESDEEEEEEGGADPGAIKKKVMGFLAQVKSKGPGDKPIQFIAAIAKGGSGVLFGKSVGSTQKKMFQEMLPNMQSPKYVIGDCIWEENAHTFVVEKIPSNFGKKLQKALMAETQVKWKVRVRGLDGQVVDADEEQEVAEEEGDETTTQGQQTTPPPPPPAPPTNEARTTFLERLRALKPDLDKVIAANVAVSSSVQGALVQISGFAKGGNFDLALKGMEGLEIAVKTGLEQMARPATQDDAAGLFRQRLAAFLPKLKEVVTANPPLGGEIRTLVMEAGNQAKAGNYDQANSLMDRAQGMVAGGGQQPAQQAQNQSNEETPTNESEGEQQADDPETLWLKKFAEMEPDYLEAVKAAPGNEAAESLISRLKAIWNLAGAKAEAEAYPVSLKALEAITKEDLFNKIKAARGTGGGIEQGIVEKRKFLVSRFQQIQVTLSAELEKLKTAMVGMLEGDEEEDPEEIVSQFDGYLEKLVDSIRDEIDEAINAGDMKSIAGMRTRIEGDEVIQHLLSNPFVNGSEFQAAFLDAVSEVEAKLAA